MNRFYFVAAVLVIGVLMLSMVFAGTRIGYFLDIASMVMVVAPPLVLSLAAFGPGRIGRSFVVAFHGSAADEPELRAAAVFFRSLERYILLSGLLGMLIGVIAILTSLVNMQDKMSVSYGVALLLITIFYALVLLLVLAVPFRTAVERRLAETVR